MSNYTWRERFRYSFDNTMSKGVSALIIWLAIMSAALIVVVSAIAWIARLAPDKSFIEIVWMSLMRTLDAGTMGGDEGSWFFLFSMFAVTLGGIFVISTLIGVLTTGMEAKLEELRKGRSKVIESNHTVILGWAPEIFTIISELTLANENQKKSCIAILSSRDKVDMEDEIRDRLGKTGRTRVVCRNGDPMDLTDLDIIGIHASKSIIVLSPDKDDAGADADVIKTILAVTNHPRRRADRYHIVAEIRDPKNMEVARMVGKDEAELILVSDLVARVVAQTCRQSGLSVVYTELLDFGGDEIYFHEEPALHGKTFGEALPVFAESTIIGLAPVDGIPALKPPMDTVLRPGDKLVVIAEDDDTTRLSGVTDYGVDEAALNGTETILTEPEKTLILGWNWRAPFVINELDNYVPPESAVTVAASVPDAKYHIAKWCGGIKNQKCNFREVDTTDRRVLDSLDVPSYNHVILLSYADTVERQEADAKTLITLLHLREIAEAKGRKFSIVSEMLDLRNRDLAEVTRADDFIVSDRLVSLMLAQISENKQLNAVFGDIFDPEGSEIYLKPAEIFVRLGVEMNFYTVLEAARRRDALAIGYKLQRFARDAAQSYGVVVNPKKAAKVKFEAGDKIVVVAED